MNKQQIKALILRWWELNGDTQQTSPDRLPYGALKAFADEIGCSKKTIEGWLCYGKNPSKATCNLLERIAVEIESSK